MECLHDVSGNAGNGTQMWSVCMIVSGNAGNGTQMWSVCMMVNAGHCLLCRCVHDGQWW